MSKDEQWLLEEKYNGQKTEGFLADHARLREGEPLAYVIGHIPFLNTTIHLDSKPLIPRPETEFWVERIIDTILFRGLTPKLRILDLCAGSGCIGVAVLKAIPEALVDFVEIDESHHTTISRNIHENGTDVSRTQIIGGNLFEKVTHTYDYILSNPPYIDKILERTESSVLLYEPHQALFAGNGGLALIERIITDAPTHLTNHGVLVIEHEPEHYARIHGLGSHRGFAVRHEKDQYNVLRYTVLTRLPEPFMSS